MNTNTAKRIALASVIVCLAAPWSAAQAQGQKVRIAVLGFENNTTNRWWGDNLGSAATDELITQLVQTGTFTVVERERLDRILAEQNIGQSGRLNPATAARIGEILGVQVVLMGSITQFSVDRKSVGVSRLAASYAEAESMLDVRVVNTVTGEIMMVAEGGGKKRFGGVAYKRLSVEREFDAGVAQEALRPAVEKAVEQIADHADELAALKPVAGVATIVGTRNGTVYIDRGENFGIEVGQRFTVYSIVDEIKDAYGNVLDTVTEQVGIIEVTQVLSQSSICRVVEGQAADGDTAKKR